MVREEQLSLCFEPQAEDEAQPAIPELVVSASAEQRTAASVHCFQQFKRRHPSPADANSVRLLEKIARKVKHF